MTSITAQAPSALHDPTADRAEKGLATVVLYLDAVANGEEPTHARLLPGEPVRAEDEEAAITDAITDVLHAADGWHWAPTVLDRAITLLGKHEPPAITPHSEPRDLDTLAGAIAALLTAAEAVTSTTPNTIVDSAETRFQKEADEARFNSVRRARQN